jgi:membrane protein implicated in regulation of membrane protease activity
MTMARPLLRYTLLQIPDVVLVGLILCALRRWWGLGDGIAWALLALWIAKDAVMYPFVRRSLLDGGERVGAAALIGAEAVADGDLAPRGWVHVRGESWQAESASGASVPAGTRVRVRAVRGLTLQVEPGPDSSSAPPRT